MCHSMKIKSFGMAKPIFLSLLIAATSALRGSEADNAISFRLVHKTPSEDTIPMPLGSSTTVLNVEKTGCLSTSDIRSASAGEDHGQWRVIVTFTAHGASRLREFMASHLKERLAIVADDKIIMAPVIREPIRGDQIAIAGVGLWNENDARQLAERINAANKQ